LESKCFLLEKDTFALMQKILMEEEKHCWIKFLKHTHLIPLILGLYIFFNDILVLFTAFMQWRYQGVAESGIGHPQKK
jgi:hypothetical protein